MKQFAFRLESVARLRVAERDERRAELSAAEDAVRQLEARRSELDVSLQETRALGRQAASPGPLDLPRLQRVDAYQKALLHQLAELERQLLAARQAVDWHRQQLVAADRQVKMLEKLRDRQLGEHRRQALLAEVRQLDEVAHLAWREEPRPGSQ